MPKFCKPIGLPPIPAELIPDLEYFKLEKTKADAQITSFEEWVVTKNSKVITDRASYIRFDAPTELVHWIDNNINNEYHNIGITYWYGGSVALPHTDLSREIVLFYLFDTGGDAVETKFWKYQGKIRCQGHIHPETYEELELLESVVLKPNTWYMLDAKVVHSVENLTGDRVALQLGLWQQTSLAKQYFSFED